MISPQSLRELVVEATANIPEINRRIIVVTDDEFTEVLNDHKASDNMLLVAVLPDYSGFGADDESGDMSFLQFFILEKVDYKGFKVSDDYINIFSRTLEAAKKFIAGAYAAMGICGGEVFEHDWNLRPVSRKAQCNGYEIQFNSKAYSDVL